MKFRFYKIFSMLFVVLFLNGCAGPANNKIAASPQPETITTPSPRPTATPLPEPMPLSFPTTGYCNGEGVNLRIQPSTESEIMDILGENAVVEVVGLTDGWYEISLGGTPLFVAEHLITLGDPPRPDNMRWGKIVTEEAAIYLAPDEKTITDAQLQKGDTIRVLRKIGEFSHVVFTGKQRYVKSECIELID